MNNILMQVENHMHNILQEYLPHIKNTDLEKDGAVFYMNDKNGTAFDWYVNDHLPEFDIFYNDSENLGAVKGVLGNNRRLDIYLYDNNGHAEPSRFSKEIQASEKELFNLAVLLMENADEKNIWNVDIRDIQSDKKPKREYAKKFLAQKSIHAPMREKKEIMSKTVIVSKKVREGGWKIGYGMRNEPEKDKDSGWFLCVGDETDEYINDVNNLELWTVGSALFYEPELHRFITAPYGTAVIRVKNGKLELDVPGKQLFLEKK